MNNETSKNHTIGEENQHIPEAKNNPDLGSDVIRTVIEEFERESEEKGMEVAARSFGVTRIVKELEEIARFRRKRGIDLDEMVRGARVARIIAKYGVGIPDLEVFLSTAYSKALEMGYTAEELVSQVAALNDLEKMHGATFDELKAQYESMASKFSSMRNERNKLNEEIAELNEQKERATQERRADGLNLEQSLEQRRKLKAANLSVEQVDNIVKLVQKIASENGLEPEKAFSQFEEDILVNYDAIHGLKAVILSLKEEERQIKDQVQSAKQQFESENNKRSEELREISERYSKVASKMEAFNDLEKRVDVNRILFWTEILQNSGVDLLTFESKLKNYASLKSLERELNQKVVELMSKATSLKESMSKSRS